MQGPVKRFADISPSIVSLRGHVGSKIERSVTIRQEPDYPFRVVDVRAQKGENIRFTWEAFQDKKGAGYRLLVENLSEKRGRYHDSIILMTDSKIRPEIRISVRADIREARSNSGSQPS